MSSVMEKFYSQMEEDSKKMREAIAEYNSFMFCAMELRGLTYNQAAYCWKHRNDKKNK